MVGGHTFSVTVSDKKEAKQKTATHQDAVEYQFSVVLVRHDPGTHQKEELAVEAVSLDDY